MAIVAPMASDPTNASGANSSAGTPTPISVPQTKATAMSSMAGATSGEMSRLARGATSESVPK